MPTPHARAAALAWFEDDATLDVFSRYEELYSELPRRLFVENGLALARGPVKTVLDVGIGTGRGLAYLRRRLPSARLVGLQPNPRLLERAQAHHDSTVELLPVAVEDLSVPAGGFDLIYSYSALRLSERPLAALQSLAQLLAPGGVAYVLDFRGDVDPELRDLLLSQLQPQARAFLAAQLDAAYTLAAVADLAEQAGLRGHRLAAGGLAGYPVRSPEALALLQRSDQISACLFQLAGAGFKSSRAAELVTHLVISRDPEESDAEPTD